MKLICCTFWLNCDHYTCVTEIVVDRLLTLYEGWKILFFHHFRVLNAVAMSISLLIVDSYLSILEKLFYRLKIYTHICEFASFVEIYGINLVQFLLD